MKGGMALPDPWGQLPARDLWFGYVVYLSRGGGRRNRQRFLVRQPPAPARTGWT